MWHLLWAFKHRRLIWCCNCLNEFEIKWLSDFFLTFRLRQSHLTSRYSASRPYCETLLDKDGLSRSIAAAFRQRSLVTPYLPTYLIKHVTPYLPTYLIKHVTPYLPTYLIKHVAITNSSIWSDMSHLAYSYIWSNMSPITYFYISPDMSHITYSYISSDM